MGRRPRIGLLGGSFNPAHDGHRTVSLRALRELRLDRVWWLVSPQNPLKSRVGMAPLKVRLAGAQRVATHSRIHASAVEKALGTRYAVDTVAALQRRWPQARFVWLVGADSLLQMPLWFRWPALFQALPIAVFDRPTYSAKALRGRAAARFARFRRRCRPDIVDASPPAWAFVFGRPHPESATRLRASRGVGGSEGSRP